MQALRESLTAWGLPAGWPVQASDAPRALAALRWVATQGFDAVVEWGWGPLTPLLAQAMGKADNPPLHTLCVTDGEAMQSAQRTLAGLPLGERVTILCGADPTEFQAGLRQLSARLGAWQAPRVLLVAVEADPPETWPWLVWQQLRPASLALLSTSTQPARHLNARVPEQTPLEADLRVSHWRA